MLSIISPSVLLKSLPWLLLLIVSYFYLAKRDDLTNCQADKEYQNAAIKQWQAEGEAAKQRQEQVDKVTAMFRAEQYRSIEQIKKIDVRKLTCDEAVERFLPYTLTN